MAELKVKVDGTFTALYGTHGVWLKDSSSGDVRVAYDTSPGVHESVAWEGDYLKWPSPACSGKFCYMKQQCTDSSSELESEDEFDQGDMYQAADAGDSSKVRELMQDPRTDVNWVCESECNTSILEAAVRSGDLSTVKALMEASMLALDTPGSNDDHILVSCITNQIPTVEIWELFVKDHRFADACQNFMTGEVSTMMEGVKSSILDVAEYYRNDELVFWLNAHGACHINPKYVSDKDTQETVLLKTADGAQEMTQEELALMQPDSLRATIEKTLKVWMAKLGAAEEDVGQVFAGMKLDMDTVVFLLGPWSRQLGFEPPTRVEAESMEEEATSGQACVECLACFIEGHKEN